jgi:uncharacterized membrane protein YhiD involved in acid resistance
MLFRRTNTLLSEYQYRRTKVELSQSVISQLIATGQVVLAMILAGIVGFEREAEDKPAGLRTHMLVGGASALIKLTQPYS